MLKIWDLSLTQESNDNENELKKSKKKLTEKSNEMEIESEDDDNCDDGSGKGKRSKRKIRKKASITSDGGDDDETIRSYARVVPLVTLSGHNEGVSDLTWLNDTEIVTAGFDHALVFWDLESGRERRKIVCFAYFIENL